MQTEKTAYGVPVPPITDREICDLMAFEIRMTHMVYPSKVNTGKCTQAQYDRRIQILQHLQTVHQPEEKLTGTLPLFA